LLHTFSPTLIAISAPLCYVVGADTCPNKFGCNKFIPIHSCKANSTILGWRYLDNLGRRGFRLEKEKETSVVIQMSESCYQPCIIQLQQTNRISATAVLQ